MNIFYLGYSLEESSGGIENYTFTILNYLKEQGHNIYVYTINGQNKKFKNIDINKIKYIDRLFLGNRVASKMINNNIKIDLFLCGHLFLVKHMEQIVKRYNKKYHLFVYGIDCWAGRFKQRVPKLKKLNKIISISSFTTEQIKKQGFNGEIIYVPPVLDINKFKVSRQPRINDGFVRFLTVGRLSSVEQYKGHDQVIEAVNILAKKGIENFEYRIVGKGDDQSRLEEKVKELNIENFIQFYGFVTDEKLNEIYAESDVFIMPSNVSLDENKPEGEGFGIVFTEAAMYELPMIGPNDGGSTDIIDNEINGLECNPLSPENISTKMMILINDKNKRKYYGKQAKEKIINNFTLKQLDGYLEKVLEI